VDDDRRGDWESVDTAVTVMTFCGNDSERENWDRKHVRSWRTVVTLLNVICFYYSALVSAQKQHTKYWMQNK